uniref:Cytochrome c oxidase subunit 3 n=1 Tax=Prasinococcus sp. CCMP1194 TaxID=110672 RepID=A0A650AKP0_9VIRI|nr:cytochrome c oxidase subunit 3 [Prasinococcus sp. CCMP1194]
MIHTKHFFHSTEVQVRPFDELYEKTPQRHPFHLVNPSPWPLFSSLAVLCITTGGVLYMHGYSYGQEMLFFGLATLIYSMGIWWRDVIREASFEGHHTLAVQEGHRIGMLLFIVSEVMFFLGFFWAFFHSSLAPAIDIGATWPPAGIEVLSPWDIPFLNTLLLLSSGASVTWAHHAILAGNRTQAIYSLIVTLVFAFLFTALQGMEYVEAPFSISDSVYGSTFFMATGFHGFHVLVGSLFLSVCLFRSFQGQFSRTHHVGFEAAAWYWHFVDVVWLFLFIAIYWWGGA